LRLHRAQGRSDEVRVDVEGAGSRVVRRERQKSRQTLRRPDVGSRRRQQGRGRTQGARRRPRSERDSLAVAERQDGVGQRHAVEDGEHPAPAHGRRLQRGRTGRTRSQGSIPGPLRLLYPDPVTEPEHKRKTMAAYLIAHIEIIEPVGYEEYRKRVPAIVSAHGGRFLARGGAIEVLEGTWSPKRLVIIEFPDMAALKAFYESPAYRPLIELRNRTATSRVLALENSMSSSSMVSGSACAAAIHSCISGIAMIRLR